MTRFFATDLRRAFTEPTFFTALFLGILMTAGGFVFLYVKNGYADFATAQSFVFPFAAPFLAALPYAFMSKSERDINFAPLLKLRRGGNGYGPSRFFTVGIAGGAVILFAEAILAVIAVLTGGVSDVLPGGVLSDILNPGIVISGYEKLTMTLLLAFPFGFAFAVLAHALCFFSRTTLIAIITPEVLYLLLTYAFPYLDLEKYYPPLAVSPYIYGTPNLVYIFTFLCSVIAVAAILTIIGEKFAQASD
jgi:hypothetical protein